MRRAPWAVAAAAAALAAAAPASAQDPIAPPGAEPHWLPDEEWVNLLWLPYDEDRLYRLLGRTRGEVFRWLRIDAHHTLAQLGRRRGYTVRRLAAALVANRRGSVPGRVLRTLRRRAGLTLTQGHLGQHLLFHALHQTAIPRRARAIFGVRSQRRFLRLRRSELSPLQIGELFGRARVEMRRGSVDALRDAAAKAVRLGQLSPRQARVMLDRQVRQVPRWLGQNRYNGPSGGRNRLRLPPGDVAKHPSIARDGGRVVWDAYRSTVREAEQLGEIHVRGADVATAAPVSGFAVSPPVDPGSEKPRSAYNAVLSGDGRVVAFESAESTYPLAKRVGQMSVVVRDLATGRLEKVSHLGRPRGAPTRTAFNPSLSADGRIVAFEATDSGRDGQPSRNGLWVFDRAAGRETLVAEHDGRGAAYLPRVAGNGAAVAYTAVDPRTEATQVVLHRAEGAPAVVVSRAAGPDGAPADSDAYEPAVSDDGSVVAFTSRAANLGARGGRLRVWVRDVRDGTTQLATAGVGRDASQPAISADGRFVAFVERLAIGDGTPAELRSRVWLHDRRTGATALVSRRDGHGGGTADGASAEPAVSADGSRVAFTSTAGNLSTRKPRGLAGVFVRDLRAGTTTPLSDPGRRASPGGERTHDRQAQGARLAASQPGSEPGLCLLRRAGAGR
jgi:Tol biopolymer transport system component